MSLRWFGSEKSLVKVDQVQGGCTQVALVQCMTKSLIVENIMSWCLGWEDMAKYAVATMMGNVAINWICLLQLTFPKSYEAEQSKQHPVSVEYFQSPSCRCHINNRQENTFYPITISCLAPVFMVRESNGGVTIQRLILKHLDFPLLFVKYFSDDKACTVLASGHSPLSAE